MDWLYFKLFSFLKSDSNVKTAFLLLAYCITYFLMKLIIIEFYGREFYLNIRRNGLLAIISIIPVVIVFIVLQIYYNKKRIEDIKEKYKNK